MQFVGAYGADLRELGEQVRRITSIVLAALLGPRDPPLSVDQVTVRVSDITALDPRT